MKFCTKVSELLGLLEGVCHVVAKKGDNPLLGSILFQVKETNGKHVLILTGNSVGMGMTAAMPVTDGAVGSICLDGKFLSDVLRKASDDTVVISTEEMNVNVRMGKSNFKFVGLAAEGFPQIPKCDRKSKKNFKISADSLKSLVNKVIFACSQDDSRPILTGVNFAVKDKVLTLSGVDGFRVASASMDIECNEELDFTVPSNGLKELLQIVNDEVVLYVDDNYLYAVIGNTKYVDVKLLEGKYVDIDQITKCAQPKSEVTVNRNDFISAIERVSIVANKGIKRQPVKVTIESEKLTISSEFESNQVTDEIECTYKDKVYKICFNGQYLLDMLKVMDQEDITLHIGEPLTPVTVRVEKNFYLILPIRTSNTEETK